MAVRTGFVTQTHTGAVSVRESIEQAGRLGFDFAEVYMDGDSERTQLDAPDVVSWLDAAGVDLLVHLPFVDIEIGSPRELVRAAARDEQRACLDAAADMGAQKAVLHASSHATPPEWSREEIAPRLLEAVRELDEYAAEQGVELCVENLPGVLFTVHDFPEVFAETDASMTFDTGHARVDGMAAPDMAAFLADHDDRVSHVHVNDARSAADEHVPTGSGTTDFETALAPLGEGWNGTVSVEVYTFDFDYIALSKQKLDAVLG